MADMHNGGADSAAHGDQQRPRQEEHWNVAPLDGDDRARRERRYGKSVRANHRARLPVLIAPSATARTPAASQASRVSSSASQAVSSAVTNSAITAIHVDARLADRRPVTGRRAGRLRVDAAFIGPSQELPTTGFAPTTRLQLPPATPRHRRSIAAVAVRRSV